MPILTEVQKYGSKKFRQNSMDTLYGTFYRRRRGHSTVSHRGQIIRRERKVLMCKIKLPEEKREKRNELVIQVT
jgi:hypothetical protein